MKYQMFSDTGSTTLTVVANGDLLTTSNVDNPYWDRILAEVVYGSNEYEVARLIDLASEAARRFEGITERVTVKGGTVYFDNDAVDSTLADAIMRGFNEGDDAFRGLALFMDNIMQNPRKHSRENLFDWLRADPTFTITPEGHILGYKGVNHDLTSIHSGPGIVNGVPQTGHLSNALGNVVEMERSKVQHDPNVACSFGLHVGTWDYASSFGSTTVKVLVNPRDVVSVPTDCNGQKMRVCRYKVVELAPSKFDGLVSQSYDNDWDEWDEEDDYGY